MKSDLSVQHTQSSFRIGNEDQWQAISYRGKACLVLAGPGSGKTFVLAHHIIYLTQYLHIDPGCVLVLTFSKAAAREMQSRYYKMLHAGKNVPMERDACPVSFGTFHSVCYHILQASSDHTWQLIPAGMKRTLLTKMTQSILGCGSDERSIQELERTIAIRKTAVGGNVHAPCAAVQSSCRNNLHEEKLDMAYEFYQNWLYENHMMDFDDMILLCEKLLQDHPAIRQHWQEKYSAILIDEFQDISPSQYRTIRLLEGNGTRIFVVGDDDQSIYGFRGADPSMMQVFLNDHQAAQVIPLRYNYRSGKRILSCAAKVIAQNQNRLSKTQISARDIPSKVCIIPLENEKEEYRTIVQLAGKNECAVIFRTHEQARGLASHLLQNHIPASGITFHKVMDPDTRTTDMILEDVKAYYRLAEGFPDGILMRKDFIRVMNKPVRFLSRQYLYAEQMVPSALWERLRHDPIQAEGCSAFFQDLSAMSRLTPGYAFTYLCKTTGYERFLEEKFTDYDDFLHFLRNIAYSCQERTDFLTKLDDCRSEMNKEKKVGDSASHPGNNQDSAGIRLLTMHACKGLEYDTVIVPDLNEGILPSRRSTTLEGIEEERRLLYVAMTRARKNLYLLYIRGNEQNPRRPSRFLNCLGVNNWE